MAPAEEARADDTPPPPWFPSVLEYGGGTMHHAALRGDREAIAKLALDGVPVSFVREGRGLSVRVNVRFATVSLPP